MHVARQAQMWVRAHASAWVNRPTKARALCIYAGSQPFVVRDAESTFMHHHAASYVH